MKQLVLVFGGTSEAHQLVRILKEKNVPLLLCVATAYGGALVEDEGVKVHVGRLTADEMAALICRTGASQVVDATHPYAVQASENIKAACLLAKVPCCRLKRAESTLQGCIQVPTLQAAVKYVSPLEGNILATTGSKQLKEYCAVNRYAMRVYPRVLPTVEAIEACLRLGFLREHIIAMQGPFSQKLNEALIEQFSIRYVISKDGGVPGGFLQKQKACQNTGATLVVVARTKEEGLSFAQVVEQIVTQRG